MCETVHLRRTPGGAVTVQRCTSRRDILPVPSRRPWASASLWLASEYLSARTRRGIFVPSSQMMYAPTSSGSILRSSGPSFALTPGNNGFTALSKSCAWVIRRESGVQRLIWFLSAGSMASRLPDRGAYYSVVKNNQTTGRLARSLECRGRFYAD